LIRLGNAAAVFRCQNKHALGNRHLSIHFKVEVYEACVPSISYGPGTRATCPLQKSKLSGFIPEV